MSVEYAKVVVRTGLWNPIVIKVIIVICFVALGQLANQFFICINDLTQVKDQCLVKPGTVVELKELSFVIYFNEIVCFQRFFYGFILILASPVSNGKPSFSSIVFFFNYYYWGLPFPRMTLLLFYGLFFFIRVFCFQQKTLSLF